MLDQMVELIDAIVDPAGLASRPPRDPHGPS
jgi:hypothetical protein